MTGFSPGRACRAGGSPWPFPGWEPRVWRPPLAGPTPPLPAAHLSPLAGPAPRPASPLALQTLPRGGSCRRGLFPPVPRAPGEGRSRSASDGHMMPAPGACAPSGPQGLFSGGSCVARASATAVASSSFLRPLGNALRIFSAPWHHEATSAMPFLARQGPRPLPLVSRVPSGFEAGRLGWARAAACSMRPWALRGAGPGCESRAACRCRGPGAACPFPAAGLEVGMNPACLPALPLPQRREFS